jgi:hypothetical protein
MSTPQSHAPTWQPLASSPRPRPRDLERGAPQRPQGLLPGFVPNLVIHGGITYEAQGVKLGGGTARVTVNLDHELGKLQVQVSELTARIAALEGVK